MSDHDQPPGLPEVTDEAGDSPKWLPLLGLALLGTVLLVMAVGRATGGDDETAAKTIAAEAAGTEEAGDAPAPAEPQEGETGEAAE